MKNLILVIGRTGSGKDTLVRQAQEVFKASSVPSYTDRPIRPTETDGVEHTFLTKEQFDEVMEKEQVFAYTKIGETGYRYCSTVEMLNRLPSDTIFYIIDPSGYHFCNKFRDQFNMRVIYVMADDETREKRAVARNGESAAFKKREEDEAFQFAEFERTKPWDKLVFNSGTLEASVKSFNLSVCHLIQPKNGIKSPTLWVGFNKDMEDKYREIFGAAPSTIADARIHYFDKDSFFSIMERLDKAFLAEQEIEVWDPEVKEWITTTFSKFKTVNNIEKYYI